MLLLPSFNLVPQEAYYWLYIQRPALGYFDHPPICSYTIGIFTQLFGNTEFGVRFGMLLYSIGTMIFIFFLSRNITGADSIAFRSVIFLNLTIFFNIHSIVATPDSPLLFFWAGSMYFFYKAIANEKSIRFWILGGIFAGFSIYSKYTGVLIYLSLFLFLIFSHRRRLLLTYKPYLAIIISLVVFSPVIYWNANNNWASFLFQSKTRAEGMTKLTLNYFFQLIISQLFELTPVFLAVGFSIFLPIFKNYKNLNIGDRLLFWFAYPTIVIFFLISFTSLVKMNWILPAYLSMIVLISKSYNGFAKNIRKVIEYVGLPSSFLFIIFVLGVIVFRIFPIEKGDTWTGWKELSEKVTNLIENKFKGHKVFIFSNEYKVPAELAFYTNYKDIILAENVYGQPALQFDFWFEPKTFEGWDGIFIFSDFNKFSNFELLNKYFDNIEFLEEIMIKRGDKIFRRFWIYHCKNYKIKEF